VVGNLAQFGLLFTLEPLTPDFTKLNPATALKNLFTADKIFDLLLVLTKASIVTWFFWETVSDGLRSLLRIPSHNLLAGVSLWQALLWQVLPKTLGVMLFISAADYIFRHFRHLKQLRMTPDEVKREHKDSQGNPQIKQQRAALKKEQEHQSDVLRILEAAVMVTNPTHIAIGLKYSGNPSELPTISCAGCEEVAREMIAHAKSANIPIYRDVPLARALFHEGRIDQRVPSHLLRAVGEVLRWAKEIQQSV